MAVAAAVILALANGAAHAELWERLAGGPQGDGAYAALPLADGGLLIAAYTFSGGSGKADAWMLRLNARGDTTWHELFGGSKRDEIITLAPLARRGVALGGHTKSRSATGTRAWLLRLNAENGIESEWSHPGKSDTAISGIVPLQDGGAILAGGSWGGLAQKWQLWAARLDASNGIVWERSHGGPASDRGGPVIATADGGFLIAGVTQRDDKTPNDVWLMKIDGDGERRWERKLGGARGEAAHAMAALPDGGAVLVGHTASKGAGKSDAWVVRLDSRGNPVWDRTFGGGDHETALDVTPMPGGDLMVVGDTRSRGAGGKDGWVARLNGQGDLVWERVVGGAEDDVLNAIAPLADGTFAVVGWTASKGAGRNDVWILTVSADGRLAESVAAGGKAP